MSNHKRAATKREPAASTAISRACVRPFDEIADQAVHLADVVAVFNSVHRTAKTAAASITVPDVHLRELMEAMDDCGDEFVMMRLYRVRRESFFDASQT